VKRLERPVVLSRDPDRAKHALGDADCYRWEPESGPPPAEAFRGVEAVFHLAGEPVAAGRWNAARKQRIRDSRVLGTRHLAAAIGALAARPRVLVSASAVGYYGDRGDEVLEEGSSPGTDFLAEICRAWEAESAAAAAHGVRVVNPRIGIVLGRGGGALARMLLPFRLGAGGRLGSGRQWMPWIHIDDLVGLILHAAERDAVSGPMNAVAPAPVTNLEFTKTLGSVLHRPTIAPMPSAVLRILVGEMAEVILSSQRVMPRVAERTGHRFRYPSLAEALRASV